MTNEELIEKLKICGEELNFYRDLWIKSLEKTYLDVVAVEGTKVTVETKDE